MTEGKSLLERLEEVESVLESGEGRRALELLVDIREAGFVNKELDQHIKNLRDENAELEEVHEWAAASAEQVRRFGGEIFENFEEIADDSFDLDLDDDEWVNLSGTPAAGLASIEISSNAEEIPEFDELEEQSLAEDLDEPSSVDFALVGESEAESEAAEEEESEDESIGSQKSFGREEATRQVDASVARELGQKSRASEKEVESEEDSDLLFDRDESTRRVSPVDSGFDAKKERTKSLSGKFKVPSPVELDEAAKQQEAEAKERSLRETAKNPAAVEDALNDVLDSAFADFDMSAESEAESGGSEPAITSEPSESSETAAPEEISESERGEDLAELSDEGESEDRFADLGVEESEEPVDPFADLASSDGEDPFADLTDEGAGETSGGPVFDSGSSGARYAAGKEPPPPEHRLRTPSRTDSSQELDLSFPSLEPGSEPGGVSDAEEDEFDFDLGFTNPEERVQAPAQSPEEPEKEEAVGEKKDPRKTAPNLQDDAAQTKPGDEELESATKREEQRTPVGLARHPTSPRDGEEQEVDENEFFALAESLAADSSLEGFDTPYRGEPVVKERPARNPAAETFDVDHGEIDNPFAHEAPTGIRHAAVESSFVLEELGESRSSAGMEAPKTNLSAIILEARRLYEQGDFSAALDIVNKILSREQDEEALELRDQIEGELEREMLESLSSLSSVPRLAIDLGEIGNLDLDHRSGFVMSQIDGTMSFEDIIELSSMSRLETMTVLVHLLEEGVIET